MYNTLFPTHFNRGAAVKWTEAGQEFFGFVQCEISDRPGTYYVRAEHGSLWPLGWERLQLVKGTEAK